MRKTSLYIFLLLCVALKAQDKIFFLDGSSKSVKVTEVGSEEIRVQSSGITEIISKSDVLFIEYKNGFIEKYNRPEKTLVYSEDEDETKKIEKKEKDLAPRNRTSLNVLALCNADLALFYERMSPNQKFGLGGMGAYNFNEHASLINNHIYILHNAKKKYDLGLFANFYPGGGQRKNSFYMGVLLKYTGFNFTSITEDSVKVGNSYNVSINIKPATGSQLATIFNIGTYSAVTRNFFIKTLFGLGGFNIRGTYKQQFNYILNSTPNNNGFVYNRSFLLKFYFGINMGFNF